MKAACKLFPRASASGLSLCIALAELLLAGSFPWEAFFASPSLLLVRSGSSQRLTFPFTFSNVRRLVMDLPRFLLPFPPSKLMKISVGKGSFGLLCSAISAPSIFGAALLGAVSRSGVGERFAQSGTAKQGSVLPDLSVSVSERVGAVSPSFSSSSLVS